MSFIAGVDYSSEAIDVVMLDTDTDEAHWHERRLDAGPGLAFDRARRVRQVMPSRASWLDSGVVLVAIEIPMSRSFIAATALARVQGALLSCLPAELEVVPMPVHRWKSVSVGRAKATKDDVTAWVLEHWSDRPELTSQDARDAYAIAWAARKLYVDAEASVAA